MFCKNLKSLRQSQGITQAQLADSLGISASTVGMYEQGRREPEAAMLKKIALVFKISVDDLLDTLPSFKNSDRDVSEVIDDITFTLKSQKGLMFNGKPVSSEDQEKIANAIKIAAAIAISASQMNKN
ncbi:MAG: hypothetical protein RUMPE_01224 [Eubacteriales bacterium SKADARSKE-1]|nr:hypothetical protein [Eubacteriales bacterium SKADARSKE-1]